MKAEIRIAQVLGRTVVRMGDQTQVLPHNDERILTVHVTDYDEDSGDSPDARKPDSPWQPLVPAHLKQNQMDSLAKTLRSDEHSMDVWKNDLYTVIRSYLRAEERDEDSPKLVHLSIRRNDRSTAKDWRHFQKIKNQLVGEEAEGVELFPAESRMVDTSNQYHLWCIEAPGGFNFGWFDGRITTSNPPATGAAQRPFVDGEEETHDKLVAAIEAVKAKAVAEQATSSPQEDISE